MRLLRTIIIVVPVTLLFRLAIIAFNALLSRTLWLFLLLFTVGIISAVIVAAFAFIKTGKAFLFQKIGRRFWFRFMLGWKESIRLLSFTVHIDNLKGSFSRNGNCVRYKILVGRIGDYSF